MKSKNRYFAVYFSGFILFFMGCSSTKSGNVQSMAKEKYKSVAKEELGKNVKYSFSRDSSYVLCVSEIKSTALNPQAGIRFIVYNLASNKIIYKDNLPNGRVGWKNAHQLEVSSTPEIVRGDEENPPMGYIYDLLTGTKITLNEQKNIK